MTYPHDQAGFKGDPNGPGADAARYYAAQLGARQRQVLAGLGPGPKNAEQISTEIGLHWYLVRPRLSELERKGLVTKTGDRGRSALGGQSTLYRPTTDVERAQFAARRAAEAEHGGTPMGDAPNINVASIDKNKGSEVRIALTEFKGQRLVDVRVYTEFSAARTPMPTRRGIALGIDQLPALVAALQAAEAMALELGMIGGAT